MEMLRERKGRGMASKLRCKMLLAVVPACVALVLAGSPVAAAEDFEDAPLAKLQEEIDKLQEKGERAKTGDLTESLAACNEELYEHPFATFGDNADYVAVPGGSFADTSGWSLKKDRTLVASRGGDAALFLADGGEAISAPMCVSVYHPTLRFFALNSFGKQLRLEIEVLYEDLQGHVKKLKIAKLRGSDTWQPSLPLLIQANLRASASENGIAVIAFKFKTKKVGGKDAELGDEGYIAPFARALTSDEGDDQLGWTIDDLYVDPFRVR
jgi:hypothetical protein